MTAISLLVAGCAVNTTASDYCRIAEPITVDRARDTPETVAQIDRENGKYECVCNKDCPK